MKTRKTDKKPTTVTYQIPHWIKVAGHLGEKCMGFGPLSFFQTDQIASSILVSRKQKSLYNNFLNNSCEDYFILCLDNQIAILWSFACVALELCSRFLQTWTFFWMFLKSIVHQLLNRGTLKCNHVAIRNFCANFFPLLSNQLR